MLHKLLCYYRLNHSFIVFLKHFSWMFITTGFKTSREHSKVTFALQRDKKVSVVQIFACSQKFKHYVCAGFKLSLFG